MPLLIIAEAPVGMISLATPLAVPPLRIGLFVFGDFLRTRYIQAGGDLEVARCYY